MSSNGTCELPWHNVKCSYCYVNNLNRIELYWNDKKLEETLSQYWLLPSTSTDLKIRLDKIKLYCHFAQSTGTKPMKCSQHLTRSDKELYYLQISADISMYLTASLTVESNIYRPLYMYNIINMLYVEVKWKGGCMYSIDKKMYSWLYNINNCHLNNTRRSACAAQCKCKRTDTVQ